MTATPGSLRSMLFEALDLLVEVQDKFASRDRMHVERIKEMSGWQKQPVASRADFRGEVPALQSALGGAHV
jgi:hypothetical protein